MSSDATPVQPLPEKRGSSTTLIIAIVLATSAIIFLFCAGVLAALLLPAIQAAREATRRAGCTNNLQQIGFALQHYQDTYHSFPPAYLADEQGQPMHSWRVLILPFLDDEAQALYERYDFDEPWDGPNNSKLADQAPRVFRCLSSEDPPGRTSYLAVVDDETLWPGAAAVTSNDILDGSSNTLALVESSGSKIGWLEPRDLTLDEATRGIRGNSDLGGFSSPHFGGASVLCADGSIHFLDDRIPPAQLRALLTIAGGEEVNRQVFGY